MIKQALVLKILTVTSLRNDHKSQFDHEDFIESCKKHNISHNFSTQGTLQKKVIVERKDITIEDMIRTMICDNNHPQSF